MATFRMVSKSHDGPTTDRVYYHFVVVSEDVGSTQIAEDVDGMTSNVLCLRFLVHSSCVVTNELVLVDIFV